MKETNEASLTKTITEKRNRAHSTGSNYPVVLQIHSCARG
ncbi:hypothetical protein SLEP1_g24209 [Rubroshorea leprosula]|uniref:Uncharacterized protein n=1 Tax=Rubroshorea leprosula TaxID=152421 RepID=A0AAV5JQA9_9ROSI|nr:hypothetical protein SLEP1_g24209 [Rubroshorea leprosula]